MISVTAMFSTPMLTQTTTPTVVHTGCVMISVTAMLSTPMLTQTTTTPTVVHTGSHDIRDSDVVHTYVDTNNNDTYSSPHW